MLLLAADRLASKVEDYTPSYHSYSFSSSDYTPSTKSTSSYKSHSDDDNFKVNTGYSSGSEISVGGGSFGGFGGGSFGGGGASGSW